MYDRTIWQDNVRDPERTYKQTTNSDGTVTMVPAGKQIQPGTNQSAANFNKMEDGIQDSLLAAAILLQHQLQSESNHEDRISVLESDYTVEAGEVVLTNSMKYPFNNSAKTISLKKVRDTTNYLVEVVILETADGLPGDVSVTDKAINGFKIDFNGSAKNVKVKYIVKGGILS